jgi:hypothetical protein
MACSTNAWKRARARLESAPKMRSNSLLETNARGDRLPIVPP